MLGAAWEDLAGRIDVDAQSVLSCLVQISALTWSLDLKVDSRHRNPSTYRTHLPVRNYTDFVHKMIGAKAYCTRCVGLTKACAVDLEPVVTEQKGEKEGAYGCENITKVFWDIHGNGSMQMLVKDAHRCAG